MSVLVDSLSYLCLRTLSVALPAEQCGVKRNSDSAYPPGGVASGALGYELRLKGVLAVSLHQSILEPWWQALREVARPKPPIEGVVFDWSWLERVCKRSETDLEALRAVFTTDRQALSRYLHDPKKEAATYLLGFHLANALRVSSMLERLKASFDLEKGLNGYSTVEIIDLGCGTGAVSNALATHLPLRLKKTAVLVDRHKAFLSIAEMIHEYSGLVERSHRVVSEIHDYRWQRRSDLSIFCLGYLYNELMGQKKNLSGLSNLLKKSATEPSLVLFLDSANQMPSRSAMTFRDELCDAGYVSIYPCPGIQTCPMNEKSRDWCYSEFVEPLPRELETVFRHMEKDGDFRQVAGSKARERPSWRLDATAFLFASPDLTKVLVGASAGDLPARVVGRPSLSRNSDNFRYLLCSSNGLKHSKTVASASPQLRGVVYKEEKSISSEHGHSPKAQVARQAPKVRVPEREAKPAPQLKAKKKVTWRDAPKPRRPRKLAPE